MLKIIIKNQNFLYNEDYIRINNKFIILSEIPDNDNQLIDSLIGMIDGSIELDTPEDIIMIIYKENIANEKCGKASKLINYNELSDNDKSIMDGVTNLINNLK